MTSEKGFYTIQDQASSEITVKHSKFIAHAAPADSKEAAEQYVTEISKRYTDATHNCYAFKLGVGDPALFRFSDAGEPSGTAGRPILQAIESKNLTNAVVVVTRYFGGTKLGTGGLIRAYSASALSALDQATIVKKYPQATLRLHFSYPLTNAVQQVLAHFDAETTDSKFGEKVTYLVQVRAHHRAAFIAELKNATGNRVQIETQSGRSTE